MVKGKRLRRARLRRKLTLAALSERSTVDLRTISDIEHGRNRHPSYDKVILLEHALELPPGTLWPLPMLRAS